MTKTFSITVGLPAPEAFRIFVYDLAQWWPTAYTWSQDDLHDLRMEPFVGGFCTEIGPHGFRIDWGRVLALDPGKQLIFSWQISAQSVPIPHPERASRVIVTFSPLSTQTKTTVVHQDWENHGEGAQEYADMMASEYGWPFMLQAYAQRCRSFEKV